MARKRKVRLSGDFQLRVDNRPAVDPLLDGEQLFTYRYNNLYESATGIERLAMYWMGPNVIRSVTLTFDVFSPYESGYTKIAPVNRSRTRYISAGSARFYNGLSIVDGYGRDNTPLKCSALIDHDSTPYRSHGDGIPSIPYYRITKDTTRKTRPYGASYGEFSTCVLNAHSPSITISGIDQNRVELDMKPSCSYSQISGQKTTYSRSFSIDFGRIPSADSKGFLANELAATEAFMPQYAAKLIPKNGMFARRYTLFRNVVELRDVPRSVYSLQKTFLDLRSAYNLLSGRMRNRVFSLTGTAKDVPNEYLSYHFGWKQVYKDVMDLLELPAKLSKEVNFLLSRSGKPTSYRRSMKFPGPTTTSPEFTDYLPLPLWAQEIGLSTWVHREREVRVVINATYDFPNLGVPLLRKDLLIRKAGILPTLSDMYDLVPWSWLVDWFTGLGDYVHAMDYINSDPSLINYGFCTGITRFRIETLKDIKVTSKWRFQYLGHFDSESDSSYTTRHVSLADGYVQARKNLASVAAVRSTSDVDSLSSFQKSILGALLLQRTPGGRR